MADETLDLLLRITADKDDAESDLDALTRALRELDSLNVVVDVDVDASDAHSELDELRNRLSALDTVLDVDADTTAARFELSDLEMRLDDLSDTTLNVNVDADTVPTAGELDRLTRPRTVDVDVEMHAQRFAMGLANLLRQVGSFKVTAVASLLALLPAAAGAATAVGGIGAAALAATAPLGLLGLAVSRALKAGTEEAKAFKQQIELLTTAFGSATRAGANATLAGLTDALRNIRSVLPGLKDNFTGLGEAAGTAFRELGSQLSTPLWREFYATLIDSATEALPSLTGALRGLLEIVRSIVTAGMPLFLRAVRGLSNALLDLAARTSDVDGLSASMEKGASVAGQLWDIFKNLLGVVKAVFTAATAGSGSFVASIERTTAKLSAFFNSAKGQKILRDALSALSALVEEIGNAIPTIVTAFGQLLNIVTPIFTAVMGVVRALQSIPGGGAIAALALAFVAFKGPLGLAVGLLRGLPFLLGALAAPGAAAAGAFWALAGALAAVTAPVALVVAAIVGLIAIGYLVVENWDWVRGALLAVWDAIKDAAEFIWGAIKAWFMLHVEAVKLAITTAWTVIRTVVVGIWNAIKSAATSTWGAIKAVITEAVNTATDIVRSVFGALSGFLSGLWNTIRSGVTAGWNTIKGAVDSAVDAVVGVIRGTIRTAVGIVSGVWETIRDGVSNGWDKIKGAIRGAVTGAVGVVRDAAGAFAGAGGAIIDAIVGGIRGAAGRVADAVRSVIQGARNLLPFSEPKDKSSPLSNLRKSGEAMMKNLAAGIRPGSLALSQQLTASLSALPVVSSPRLATAGLAGRSGDTYNVTRNYNLPPGPNGYVEPTFAAAQLDNLLRDEGTLR